MFQPRTFLVAFICLVAVACVTESDPYADFTADPANVIGLRTEVFAAIDRTAGRAFTAAMTCDGDGLSGRVTVDQVRQFATQVLTGATQVSNLQAGNGGFSHTFRGGGHEILVSWHDQGGIAAASALQLLYNDGQLAGVTLHGEVGCADAPDVAQLLVSNFY